ncbi:DUF1963 domain-containing protein [Pseudomonas syringae]|nr:DUF1963 domain-containing protein [Pseudomonas syringae]MBD8792642.1 DUF1963 domain-containing protein [Pseudomonas syringae]MBD8802948.1 DUF1963 domain-containing protein [Pseudomonas syringae]MBD8813722.1 DUF1963 domain-containing protein [Pseudomonas syringae]
MDIQDIKRELAKPATTFEAGGFRPANTIEESWLGRVFLYRPDEELPLGADGQPLLPLAQFYLPALPCVSPQLANTRVLTVFIAKSFGEVFAPMGDSWLIREYGYDDELVRKDLTVPASFIKAFPLKAEKLEEDYPLWDGGGVPLHLDREICALIKSGDLDSYYDFTTHSYKHKIGGYPSFCQPGVDPGEDFEFVFQVSSDPKINLNVVHSGSLMFWKHRVTGEWTIYYDFY